MRNTRNCSRRWRPIIRAAFAVRIGFDNRLAHRIEAGADMFLMPSRYEPCGLNQIYSLRYGTVPIVRATGGLDDTINEETGFKFSEYSGDALLRSIRAAGALWRESGGVAKDDAPRNAAGLFVDGFGSRIFLAISASYGAARLNLLPLRQI